MTKRKPEPPWWERLSRYTDHRRPAPDAPCEVCGTPPETSPYLCDAPDIVSRLDALAEDMKHSIPGRYYDREPSATTVLEHTLDLAAIVRRLAAQIKEKT